MAVSLPLERHRGDTIPFSFVAADAATGAAIPIAGYTFTMSVSEQESPDTPLYQFQLTGVITDAAAGEFEFQPSPTDMDLRPGKYYYDVESVNPATHIHTMVKDTLTIIQDISK